MSLQVKNLKVTINSRKILDGIEFYLNKGELVALLGPNGSGKSTILRTIFGILKPSDGAVYLNGYEINKMDVEDVAKILGYLPQEYTDTNLSVLDVVLLGRTPYINLKPSKIDYDMALEALKLVGMDSFAKRKFSELSGGEKQKVMLARIFCQKTEFLLLDEPTAHLDVRSQIEIMEIIKRIVKKGKSAIVAMHDINLALSYCDKIIMVKKGEIVRFGTPDDVINPKTVEEVFGVKAEILRENGRPIVIPVGVK